MLCNIIYITLLCWIFTCPINWTPSRTIAKKHIYHKYLTLQGFTSKIILYKVKNIAKNIYNNIINWCGLSTWHFGQFVKLIRIFSAVGLCLVMGDTLHYRQRFISGIAIYLFNSHINLKIPSTIKCIRYEIRQNPYYSH